MNRIVIFVAIAVAVVAADYVDDDNDAVVVEAGSSESRQGRQLELVDNGLELTYQFRMGQGACVNSKGLMGKCTSRQACYPLFQTPSELPSWAYGSSELCTYGEGREDNSGVCCSSYQGPFPGIVASSGAPVQRQNEYFIYPASTMPLQLGFRQQPGGFPGGQYPGGFGGGQFPGGFPGAGGQYPGGFPGAGGQYPGGFPGAGGQYPGGFPGAGGQYPGGFPGAGGQYPGGFPGGQQPGGFPGGQHPGGFPGGQQPGGFPGGQHPQPHPQPQPQPTPPPPAVEPVVQEEEDVIPADNNPPAQPENTSRYRECGTSKYTGLRVAGGTRALKAEFPWSVALFNRGRQFCGGSLISPTHILTAAHCVDQMTSTDAQNLIVRLGDHNLDDRTDAQTVEKSVKLIVKNKLFSMQTLHHDVAILVMDTPVTYAENIRPICLASGGSDYAGEQVTVSGWGLLRENGPRPTELQKLTMEVWKQDECKRIYTVGSPAGITPHMLCAGKRGKDSCSGDSGGPLVHKMGDQRMEQVGIVSWGIGCGKEDFPGVYTRVTEVRDWINKVMASY